MGSVASKQYDLNHFASEGTLGVLGRMDQNLNYKKNDVCVDYSLWGVPHKGTLVARREVVPHHRRRAHLGHEEAQIVTRLWFLSGLGCLLHPFVLF